MGRYLHISCCQDCPFNDYNPLTSKEYCKKECRGIKYGDISKDGFPVWCSLLGDAYTEKTWDEMGSGESEVG
jgi:hypothetical protein